MGVNKKKKLGRPTDYTPDLADEICDAIASTSKGITPLCKEHEHWPNPDTIFTWRKIYKDFSEKYAIAKQYQIEVMIDEILMIADDTSQDYVTNDEGNVVINHQHINRARLKIDTRKWLAARLCPRLYGDKDGHVSLKFPSDFTKGDALLPMYAEVFRALAGGEITPEQARLLTGSIKDYSQSLIIGDLDKRLSEIENPRLTFKSKLLDKE